MSCVPGCYEVIHTHTVGFLTIPRASIKWVYLWELLAYTVNMHTDSDAYIKRPGLAGLLLDSRVTGSPRRWVQTELAALSSAHQQLRRAYDLGKSQGAANALSWGPGGAAALIVGEEGSDERNAALQQVVDATPVRPAPPTRLHGSTHRCNFILSGGSGHH